MQQSKGPRTSKVGRPPKRSHLLKALQQEITKNKKNKKKVEAEEDEEETDEYTEGNLPLKSPESDFTPRVDDGDGKGRYIYIYICIQYNFIN